MAELDLHGRVALVTGAGRGLGRAYALALAERGAALVVNDPGVTAHGTEPTTEVAETVVREIVSAGGRAVADFGDVARDAPETVAHAIDEFGRLDIVINNAGVNRFAPFGQMPDEDFDLVLDTHLGGAIRILRSAWPHLERGPAGRVINISSNSVFGTEGVAPYITAKAGMIGLTRALAAEGAPAGITVNALMPAAATRLIDTVAEGRPAFKAFMDNFPAAAAAPLAVWLAHESTSVSGEIFSVAGGRAARVFIAEAAGVIPRSNTPEAWRDSAGALMTTEGSSVPASTLDELLLIAKELGIGDLSAMPTPSR